MAASVLRLGFGPRRRTVAAAVGLAIVLWIVWPRHARLTLSDGSSVEIVRVTVGPKHACPIPFTLANLKLAYLGRVWPKFTDEGPDNSIALWIDDSRRLQVRDELWLVDRHGWRWQPDRGSLSVSPIVFPTMETTSPLNLEVVAQNEVVDRLTITAPSRQVSEVPQTADPLPFETQSGRLAVRLEGVDVRFDERRRNGCAGRAWMTMTWNGHPIRPQIVDLRIVDPLWRSDHHAAWGSDGRFGTPLSPFNVPWRFQFLVGRDPAETLEPDEEFLLEPDWTRPLELQTWDQTIAGLLCRVTWSQASGRIAIPSINSSTSAPTPWFALGAKVTVETPPNLPAAVRIDFLRDDGLAFHRGVLSPLPKAKSRIWGTNSGAAKFPERYRIRVGIDLRRPVTFTVRPRIVPRPPGS